MALERRLQRSNSSLELATEAPPLRRDFGSHGSVDRAAASASASASASVSASRDQRDGFFAMLRELQPTHEHDQRSPGPQDFLRAANNNAAHHSPKPRSKLHKLWPGSQSQQQQQQQQPPQQPHSSATPSAAVALAHYDCKSLTADLALAARLHEQLAARRRNTATGASAAQRASRADADAELDDGDGRRNDLVDDCPFFRNEIGGEEERNISLNWKSGHSKRSSQNCSPLNSSMHQPSVAYGLSVMEFPPGQSHWGRGCHLARLANQPSRLIESQDLGALYYRKYFRDQEHQNWFGMDEHLGPVAISIKKEKIDAENATEGLNNGSQWQYRIIVRTSELLTLRGSILEDAVLNIKPSNNNKSINAKEVIEYIAPEIQLSCLRLGTMGSATEEQLLRLDEQCLSRHYKVGIMYCRQGQATEEDMYNNQEAGPAFVEFLQMLGQTVRLKGFQRYKAGLDNKTDSTGLYSVHTVYQDCEIMFHVSTMLPYTPNNKQQLLRKRHIGNDIVTVVFQEPGAQRFTPKNIRSQFQHVFIVVRAVNPCTDNTHYTMAVSRSKEVSIFGPPIYEGSMYPKGKAFTEFLLAKVINAENAAHQSVKFSTMATRTRQEYLKDLSKNYVTNTLLDTGQKFSLFSSLLKTGATSGVNGVKLLGNSNLNWTTYGALSWSVVARDEGRAGALTECFLGLSRDTLVLIEECTRQMVFVAPTKSILGWSWWGEAGGVRIYYHRGESVAIRTREITDAGDLMRALTLAAPAATLAIQLQLRRNNAGQLGFHVQPDGVVTQVETGGGAARAGLTQGARLVEICTVAVCTLSHDQMVDLLKTSAPVMMTVIPPLSNGTTRGCCIGAECPGSSSRVTGGGQLPGRHRRRYDRSFSPPRSGTSSGYGTGNSSKSYSLPEQWPQDVSLPIEAIPHDYPSIVKSDLLDTSIASQSSTVTYRHSQEIVNHSEFRGDKIWSDGQLERSDYSPRPQVNSGSRRGTPASGHQSPANQSAEARLKTPRNNRNSAGSNNTLQENLMKLINPDYVENNNVVREEGILTQARPATVISSTSSGGSPAPNPPLPLPDARLMDWPSLVDTATKAMLQICEEQYPSLGDGEGSIASGGAEGLDISETWNSLGAGSEISAGTECCSLRRQLNELENKVSREMRARKALEEEVKRLKLHNRRLREESVRAVQQLQRFTNWFFKTVERQ